MKRLTYAEKIQDSLNKVKRTDDTGGISYMFRYGFEHLCSALSVVQIHIAKTLLMQDSDNDFSVEDIEQVILGGDRYKLNSLFLGMRWRDFIAWLLDEEIPAPDEDGVSEWMDGNTLFNKWNEYVEIICRDGCGFMQNKGGKADDVGRGEKTDYAD